MKNPYMTDSKSLLKLKRATLVKRREKIEHDLAVIREAIKISDRLSKSE